MNVEKVNESTDAPNTEQPRKVSVPVENVTQAYLLGLLVHLTETLDRRLIMLEQRLSEAEHHMGHLMMSIAGAEDNEEDEADKVGESKPDRLYG